MPSDKYPDLKGTIFIVTYGRSGSTLLQSLLQSIPGAHITGENTGTLEGLYLAGKRARLSHRTWGQKSQSKSHPWYGIDKIDPDRYEQRLAEVFIEEILQPPADTRWYGFKEIRYPRLENEFPAFLQFCQRNFENPFFVFNSRNGEEVAKSKWWAKHPREKVLTLVKKMDSRFARFAKNNAANSHHVFHEETVADPQSLMPLFTKIGEPLDLDLAAEILSKPLTH